MKNQITSLTQPGIILYQNNFAEIKVSNNYTADKINKTIFSLHLLGNKQAFHARGSQKDIAINSLIKFGNVETNIHGGYNKVTSKFTCNDRGLYLFYVTLSSLHGKGYGAVWYMIVQDDEPKARGVTGHGVASVSTHFAMIRCNPRSQVWVKQGTFIPPWKQGMWPGHSQFGAFCIL